MSLGTEQTWYLPATGTADQSGNSRDGTYVGGMGVSGGKFVLDGVNDCMTIPVHGSAVNHTVTAWVNTSASSFQVLFHDTPPSASRGVFFAVLATGVLRCYWGSTSGWNIADSTGTVNDGSEHFVCAVWEDGVGGKLYIDNAQDGSIATSNTLSWAGTTKAAVGCDSRSGGGLYVNGEMDDIRSFNTNLSTSDLTSLYNGGTPGYGSGGNAASVLAQQNNQRQASRAL